MRSVCNAFLCIIVLAAATASADTGKLKGYLFGDYYYVVSADDGEVNYPEKQNAFEVRRLYFTYDRALSDDFSMRYRLEANDAGFGSGSKMTPYVKHAYLRWRGAAAGADLYLGMSGTPIWALSESVWGYRSIEKTVLDLHGLGSSADLGVAVKGEAGKLGYHIMIGNGTGQRSESNSGKKVYASVSTEAGGGVVLEAYADYNALPADRSQMTVKGFAAVERTRFRAGLEGFVRVNQKAAAGGDDQTLAGASAFGVMDLSDCLAGFGRIDVVNDDAADTTDLLLIAGVDHTPGEGVHIMPNLYVNLPDGPDPTVQGRVTVFYTF